jgi:hypothetical protein
MSRSRSKHIGWLAGQRREGGGDFGATCSSVRSFGRSVVGSTILVEIAGCSGHACQCVTRLQPEDTSKNIKKK